ncbi:DivIVA domain-containing protein [Micromonospora pisi]|uniref:Cell wall synthesis protein Wag31 n=1 Tax=Micromonospora pisi TaxID=589240 RepID=A0A495JD53_9ACTN|nr:DivIVA domain-containing protein [Micromonospora pisi]RKR86282.1 DivIVA domain-containing protein [Micromonospora pisi]
MIYPAADARLHSHHVRAEAFGTRWRGLDPAEVHAYLHRVADELDSLHRDLANARADAERAKQGLRQWQTRHIGCRFSDPQWPFHTNRGPR